MKNASEIAYLESSALVKLAIVEEESEALREALREWPRRTSSSLSVVEVLRTVRRRHAAREPLARDVLGRVSLVGMGGRILLAASRIDPVELRSLDAIHVATALRLGSGLAAFVSYDARQLEAATALGLPTASPA